MGVWLEEVRLVMREIEFNFCEGVKVSRVMIFDDFGESYSL